MNYGTNINAIPAKSYLKEQSATATGNKSKVIFYRLHRLSKDLPPCANRRK